MARIRPFIQARLPTTPMLLRVLRPTRLGQGSPAWIDAAHFNIADHVLAPPTGLDLVRDNLQKRRQAVRHFHPSRLIRSTHTLRALSLAPGPRACNVTHWSESVTGGT